MQIIAETSVSQHMKALQAEFFVQNTKQRNPTAPFLELEEEDVERLLNLGMKRSERWRKMRYDLKKPINEIKYRLPDLTSRSKNCLYAVIENPDDELLFAIILKNFSDRQIKIEKKIINFIISRIDRSYRKIDEFIYKID